MYILLGILLALILLTVGLMLLRATVTLEYRDEVSITLQVLFIKIKLLPKKKKRVNYKKFTPKKLRRLLAKKHKKELKKWNKSQAKKLKKAQKKQKLKEAEQKGGKVQNKRSLSESIGLIKALLEVIPARLLHHLTVKLARLNIVVASNDAAKTALMYGAVSQTVAYIVAFLDQMTHLKYAPEPEVSVSADFLAEKPTADIKLSISLRVWHLFDLLILAVKEYVKIK